MQRPRSSQASRPRRTGCSATCCGPRDPGRAEMHLRRCLDLEAPLGHPDVRAACLWSLALHEATRNPPRRTIESRSLALVGANRGGPLLAYAWQARLRLVWRTLQEDQAIAESLEALDAIERLRAGQKDDGSRAALFSSWTRDYYWLTGRLLEAQPPRLAQAFEVGERLRARVLLEYLAQAGVPRRSDADRARHASSSRDDLPARNAGCCRRRSAEQERHAAARSARAARARASRARRRPDRGRRTRRACRSRRSRPSSRRSTTREAMLWFSIAPWKDLYGDFGGGAWARRRDPHVSDRSPSRRRGRARQPGGGAHRAAARTGMPRRACGHRRERAGQDTAWWRRRGLPPGIERLVIVSDGVLHRLPFEALPADRADRAARRALRDQRSCPRRRCGCVCGNRGHRPWVAAALVLADPELSRGSPDGDLSLDAAPVGEAGSEGDRAACSTSTPATCSKAAPRRSAPQAPLARALRRPASGRARARRCRVPRTVGRLPRPG